MYLISITILRIYSTFSTYYVLYIRDTVTEIKCLNGNQLHEGSDGCGRRVEDADLPTSLNFLEGLLEGTSNSH